MKDRSDLSTIPVVILTGSLNADDERKARRMGAVDYWRKPTRKEEILSTTECLKKQLVPIVNDKRKKEGSGITSMILCGQHQGSNARTTDDLGPSIFSLADHQTFGPYNK